jgi:hypothetical protein
MWKHIKIREGERERKAGRQTDRQTDTVVVNVVKKSSIIMEELLY